MTRDVDEALAEQRPAKVAIRDLWLEECRTFHADAREPGEPLYLTLAGAHGFDIRLLMENGLVGVTQVGGIAADDFDAILAVERSPRAEAQLRRTFPGLRVIPQNVSSIVGGPGLLSWPDRAGRSRCRARVVNLDFNGPLSTHEENGQVVFPDLRTVEKLARIHAEPPIRRWSLLLTFSAAVPWDARAWAVALAFLRTNVATVDEFRVSLEALLGKRVVDSIRDDRLNPAQLTQTQIQRVLMAFVPKRIADLVRTQGWTIETRANMCYGGNSGAAMVTWILRFNPDARVSTTPDIVYRENVISVLREPRIVDDAGTIGEIASANR